MNTHPRSALRPTLARAALRRGLPAVLALLALVIVPAPLPAADWLTTGTADWRDSANWSGGAVPGSAITIVIGASGGVSGTAVLATGTVTTGNSGGNTVGFTNTGGFIITGNAILNSTAGEWYLGRSGGNGSVFINGNGYWNNASALSVGRSDNGAVAGVGYLEIIGSGSVTNTAGYIGYQGAASGTVLIKDFGYWRNTSGVNIGGYNIATASTAQGVLLITDNGRLTNGSGQNGAFIGGSPGSSGTVSIDGSGYWEDSTRLRVGNHGAGMLILDGSGSMKSSKPAENDTISIGHNATAVGAVIVRGASRLIAAGGQIWVGNNGAGTLTVEDSAVVDATGKIMVANGSGNGTVFLNGGVLQSNGIEKGAGSGALFFNGGTLRAVADSASYITGVTITNTGGAFIDTGTFDIGVVVDLGGSGGTGGLAKLGEGALVLSTAQTYTGTTTVASGTLHLTTDNAIVASAAVNIAGDAVLRARHLQTLNNLSGDGGIAPVFTDNFQDTHIIFNSTADTVFSGSFVSGLYLMEKTGAGALTLSNTGTGIFGSTYNLVLNEGSLVFASGTFGISATATIAAGGTLGITAGAGRLIGSSTSSFTFAPGAVLDIHGAVTSPTTLIVSGSALTAADLQNITLLNNGASNEVSHDIYSLYYLTLASSDHSLQVNSSLIWTNTAGPAHGTFNIAAGADFDPGIALADRAAGPGFTPYDNWDGKSLTKTGDGLLTLATAAAYTGVTTVTAGTLALVAPDAIATSTAVFIAPDAALAATGTQTLQNLAGSGALATQDNASLIKINSLTDTAYAGIITGAGALEKTGPATLTLSAAAAHTGATTVTAGTLALAAADAIASSTAVTIAPDAVIAATGAQTLRNLAGSGTLATQDSASLIKINASSDTAYAGIITGAGALEKTGPATLTLSASHTFTGGAAVTTGTLALAATDALRSASAVTIGDGAALTSSAAQTLQNLTGAGSLTLGSAALTLHATAPATYAGSLSAGSLEKTGPAALTLAATGAFATTGALNIAAGSLDLMGAGGTFTVTGALTLASSATLGIYAGAASVVTGAATFDPGSVINIRSSAGSGGLTLITSAAPITTLANLTLYNNGGPNVIDLDKYNTYALLLNSDSTALLVDTILVWNSTGEAHGTFNIGAGAAFTPDGALADRAPGSFTAFASWDGKSLTKTGDGLLTLSTAASYTGVTTVSAGTLALTAADAIASSAAVTIAPDATLAATGAQTLRNLTGAGVAATQNQSSLFIVDSSSDTTFAGSFTGEGSVAKTGAATLTLAGASTHTGGLAVNAGRLIAQNAAAPGVGALTIAPGATVEFNLAPAATGEFAGVVAGSGAFLKTGDGALTLAGPTFASGALAINAGALSFGDATRAVTGAAATLAIASGASLTLGAGSALAIGGDATLADNARLSFIIGADTGPALTAATLGIGQNVALNLAGITGTATGARFTLINTAAGITGDFNPVTIGASAANPDYLSYTAAKSSDGKTYTIDATLAWTRDDGTQHGTFTLGAGEEFIIATPLADNTATGATGWDSATLTKDGDGTLVFAAQNTYTGATNILNGALALAVDDAIASSATIAISAGASLAATGTQTLRNLTGSGTAATQNQSSLLILDSSSDTTFSGVLTGEGGVAKTGAATLALTARNTYEGGTDIRDGAILVPTIDTLGDGADDGAPATLAIARGATLEIAPALTTGNATLTGTLGAITTGAGDTAITRVRALAGDGTLRLTATTGILTLNRDNPGFTGAIAIAGGLTETIVSTTVTTIATTTGTDPSLFDRTIEVTRVTTITQDGVILSTATAAPVVTGTTVSTGAIGAVTTTGTAVAPRGARLLATTAGALGAATVTIGESGTLEYRGVAGVSSAIHNAAPAPAAGAYSLPSFLVASSTLTLDAAGEGVPAITINKSALTLAHPRALGDGVVRAALDAGSSLLFAAGHARLAAVSMTGGAATLGFAAPDPAAPAFATAEIATLAGAGADNKLAFHVDFSRATTGVNPAGTVANHLHVTGSFSGSYAVTVNNTGTLQYAVWPTEHGISVELLRTDAASTVPNALSLTAGSRIEAGLVAYELKQGDGTGLLPDTKAWYLADTGVSRVADAIFNTAALAGEDWHYALDSLHLRLGDLRATDLPSTTPLPKADRWLRFRSYRLDGDSALSGAPFTQYAFGFTAGADRFVRLKNATLAIGALLETGIVTRNFDGGGKGESRSLGAGAYAAWHHAAGWFADTVLKVDNYNNTLGGATSYGEVNNASYNTHGLGLSVELGRRIESADGWWLEASLQGALLHLGSSSYDTRPGGLLLHVETDAATSLQYRGQVRFGHQFRDTKLHPYARAGAARSETSGGVLHASYLSRKPAYEYDRAEFGVGFIYSNSPRSQFYFDYEYASATHYTRPWSINIGYRRAW